VPESFYGFELFSPKVFADANSIWLTSLGDLLINVVLLFYLSFYVFSKIHFELIIEQLNDNKKQALSFVLFLDLRQESNSLNADRILSISQVPRH
jgi:hypothetical protein